MAWRWWRSLTQFCVRGSRAAWEWFSHKSQKSQKFLEKHLQFCIVLKMMDIFGTFFSRYNLISINVYSWEHPLSYNDYLEKKVPNQWGQFYKQTLFSSRLMVC